MTHLFDVNLLVSLAWPNHVHHEAAHRWFRARRRQAWATTPVTECGFVRVSSNRSAIATAAAPSEALALLREMRAVPRHVFLPDDVDLVTGDPPPAEAARMVSHRLVTDIHLLALARRHGARLATFDRGLVIAAGAPDDVELIPVR